MANGWCLTSCIFVLLWIYGDTQDVTYHIQEEITNSTYIGNITKDSNLFSLVGSTEASKLLYSIITTGNLYAHYFRIEERLSTLYTNQLIDREEICEFSDTCMLAIQIAVKSNLGSFFRILKVNIYIDDINDHSPVFEETSLTLPISEAVLVGTSFSINGARDKDTSEKFSLKTYELESADLSLSESLPFSIQFVKHLDGSSIIKLFVNAPLDREVKDFYDLVIIAKDGDQQPRVGRLPVRVQVLDENDNPPKFSAPSFNVTVNEEASIGAVIITLSASDPDFAENGLVKYRLSPRQATENLRYFKIRSDTGELTLGDKIVYSPGKKYKLIVEAYDNPLDGQSLTAQALVIVNVENSGNNPPEIKINLLGNAKVSEQANRGTVVAYVTVEDHDVGKAGTAVCIIDNMHFEMRDFEINEYKVTVAGRLDFETRPVENITVLCRDNGEPRLESSVSFIVSVLDENDHAPQFSKRSYLKNIPENMQIGEFIMEVSAYDLDSGENAEMRFVISSEYKDYFYLENSTSKANTANLRLNKTLDRELKPAYVFPVYAIDGGLPAKTGSVTVSILVTDINDEPPLFTKNPFQLHVLENLPADSIVGTVTAIDNDLGTNAQVEYKIHPLDYGKAPFVVFANGMIKTNRELDRETRDRYEFQVIATDLGEQPLSATGSVVVTVWDANDMDPEFIFPVQGNNTVYIPTTTGAWKIVTRIRAFDEDEVGTGNSKLSYSIHGRNDTVESKIYLFQINPNTGEIQVTQDLDASFTGKTYKLEVQASDFGKPTKRAVVYPLVLKIGSPNMSQAQAHTDTLSSQNFLIAVIVGVITVVLSIGILATICIIRKIDRERKEDVHHMKTVTQDAESRQVFDGSITVFSLPSEDSLVNEKKKKEVSFSLEDDVFSDDDLLQKNGLDHNNRHFKPNLSYLAPGPKKVEDNHSETSGDTGTSDSGRGGSDEEIHNSISQSPRDKMMDLTRQIPPMAHQEIIPFSFKKGLSIPLHSDFERPSLLHSDFDHRKHPNDIEMSRYDLDPHKTANSGMNTMAVHLQNDSLDRSRNKVVLLQTDSGIHSDTNSNEGDNARDCMI